MESAPPSFKTRSHSAQGGASRQFIINKQHTQISHGCVFRKQNGAFKFYSFLPIACGVRSYVANSAEGALMCSDGGQRRFIDHKPTTYQREVESFSVW